MVNEHTVVRIVLKMVEVVFFWPFLWTVYERESKKFRKENVEVKWKRRNA